MVLACDESIFPYMQCDHNISCTNCDAFQSDKDAIDNYSKALIITQNISGQSRSMVTVLLGI